MIFSGMIKTTDGRKWSVGFDALSWDDAESIAAELCVGELGMSFGTTKALDPDPHNLDEPESHFCAWHYRDGRFVK